MSESQTPRMDEAIAAVTEASKFVTDTLIGTARQLETELTATRARLAELEGIAEAMYNMAYSLASVTYVTPPERSYLTAYEAYKEGKK